MAERFSGKYTGYCDDDVSERYGIQSQTQSSNPSLNPHWSPPRGQSIQPPSAAPSLPVGRYVGPNFQPTNQFLQRDKCVQFARCSLCFVIFGVFLVIAGSVMLGTASNFDVGPNWRGPPPTNPLWITGPIALTIGISLLVVSCIIISIAKKRVAANSQNTGYVANNFGGPQPVISGPIDNGINPATLTFSDECRDDFPDHPHHPIHDHSSSSQLDKHDDNHWNHNHVSSTGQGTNHNDHHWNNDHSSSTGHGTNHNDHHWNNDHGSSTGHGTNHNDYHRNYDHSSSTGQGTHQDNHHDSSSNSNHHDVSSSHCHDTITSTCDTSPSTDTTD